MVISENELSQVLKLIEENKVMFDPDCEVDLIKQGYGWDKSFVLKCMKKRKHYTGKELYVNHPHLDPNELKKRLKRIYCIHKPNKLFFKLVLIGYYIRDDLLIIHISPSNRNSWEGKVYYNKL